MFCVWNTQWKTKGQGILTFSGPSIMEQSGTYFYYKNTQTLHVYFVDKILFLCPLSDCWPFLASVFCYYVFIERKKTLSTDFSLIRDNVFIHYTPIILIKIKFMCLVLCIILKIFSKALCSIVTLSPECCRTSIHVYWWLKSTWPWRHSKLVPLVRWTPSYVERKEIFIDWGVFYLVLRLLMTVILLNVVQVEIWIQMMYENPYVK